MWCGQGYGGDVRTKEWLLEYRLLKELEQIEKMLEEIRVELAE